MQVILFIIISNQEQSIFLRDRLHHEIKLFVVISSHDRKPSERCFNALCHKRSGDCQWCFSYEKTWSNFDTVILYY